MGGFVTGSFWIWSMRLCSQAAMLGEGAVADGANVDAAGVAGAPV